MIFESGSFPGSEPDELDHPHDAFDPHGHSALPVIRKRTYETFFQLKKDSIGPSALPTGIFRIVSKKISCRVHFSFHDPLVSVFRHDQDLTGLITPDLENKLREGPGGGEIQNCIWCAAVAVPTRNERELKPISQGHGSTIFTPASIPVDFYGMNFVAVVMQKAPPQISSKRLGLPA